MAAFGIIASAVLFMEDWPLAALRDGLWLGRAPPCASDAHQPVTLKTQTNSCDRRGADDLAGNDHEAPFDRIHACSLSAPWREDQPVLGF
jgi:hypothetical protein